jgi:hypothetical protein
VELLRNLATVAFQTIYSEQQRRKRAAGNDSQQNVSQPARRPAFIDTCHALAADGDVVKQHWPAFHRPGSDA